ncbi:MAG: MraY family glycosyltransferase [Patescibacteria group bacterium]|jgi:UDP-GlcNAc:undecaprenyl-phosphate GlcNAc-1-phosphate transferase
MLGLYINYFLAFSAAFILAVVFTWAARALALHWGVVDRPDGGRKLHLEPVPLLGGLGVFLAFFAVVFYFAYGTDMLVGQNILLKYLWALLAAGGLLMIGGVLDDKFNLKPKWQIVWPILAILAVIAGGIGVSKITNPFGGLLYLDQYQWIFFWHNGIAYKLTLFADLLTFFWLLGMMYTVKLLDGLDGLVSGFGAIGALIIFLLSTATRWWQPDTALLAIILCGAASGFLVWNRHPAKIFLGEGGPLFIGFMLGVLSIIAGGKIATALLIMGVPILDVLWVILRRLFWEKKNPFRSADRGHLHFRLLDIGLSHRQAVWVLYLFAAGFGSLALFLQSQDKLIALGAVAGVMIVLGGTLAVVSREKNVKIKNQNGK